MSKTKRCPTCEKGGDRDHTDECYESRTHAVQAWNDALHEMKIELLDGVAAHHWLAMKVLEVEDRLKKLD